MSEFLDYFFSFEEINKYKKSNFHFKNIIWIQ